MNGITLNNKHLIIGADLVDKYFKEVQYVFIKWVENSGSLLIAPQDASVFYQVHKD
ncbi:MAG: hypothetical protein AAGI07_00365 [Bacteroidota bacterium]